ncbi:hypothetical protein JCM6882_006511 [Rhodosporidiobolus microsporus]
MSSAPPDSEPLVRPSPLTTQTLAKALTLLSLSKPRNPSCLASQHEDWMKSQKDDVYSEYSDVDTYSEPSDSGLYGLPKDEAGSKRRVYDKQTLLHVDAETSRFFGMYCPNDERAHVLDSAAGENSKSVIKRMGVFNMSSWGFDKAPNLFRLNRTLHAQMDQHAFAIVPNEPTMDAILEAIDSTDEARKADSDEGIPPQARDISPDLRLALRQLPLRRPLFTVVVLRPSLLGTATDANSSPAVNLSVPLKQDKPYGPRTQRAFHAVQGQLIDDEGVRLPDFPHATTRPAGDEVFVIALVLSFLNKAWRKERVSPLASNLWTERFSQRVCILLTKAEKILKRLLHDPLHAATSASADYPDDFNDSNLHQALGSLSIEPSSDDGAANPPPMPSSDGPTTPPRSDNAGEGTNSPSPEATPRPPRTRSYNLRQRDSRPSASEGTEAARQVTAMAPAAAPSLGDIALTVLRGEQRRRRKMALQADVVGSIHLDLLFNPIVKLDPEHIKTLFLSAVFPGDIPILHTRSSPPQIVKPLSHASPPVPITALSTTSEPAPTTSACKSAPSRSASHQRAGPPSSSQDQENVAPTPPTRLQVDRLHRRNSRRLTPDKPSASNLPSFR